MSMNKDTGSRFYRVALTAEEEQMAKVVSPLFLALLQNKIEAYAHAVVESSLPYDADPAKQVKAILEHERLKNFVSAYEELLAELLDTQPTTHPSGD